MNNEIIETMNIGLDVLDRADIFMLERTKRVPPPAAEGTPPAVERAQAAQVPAQDLPRADVGTEPVAETGSGGGAKMDNTLRPTDKLTRTMSLEEASTWLKTFTNYLNWNKAALDRKSNADVRHLLEINLDAGSKLDTDETINKDSPVRGPTGILIKLKQYFLDDYQLMVRRHDFTECKQARGEVFKVWWDKKKAKAVECALETMGRDDIMKLELVRGVSDSMLQKKLLMEQKPTLATLVQIAEQWQQSDSVQTALGGESAEFVRKVSEYRHQKTENWKNLQGNQGRDRQSNDRQSSLDACANCGVKGDKMHSKDACPAKNREFFNCGTLGHYGRMCRRDKTSRIIRVAETHGGGSNPTPMMRDVRVTPRDGGAPFTFNVCPDTGCTQTLVSADVARQKGLTVDTRSRKRVRAVNGQKLDCLGTVTFDIDFQGKSTEVVALVSSSIADEVLLSWQDLQKLGVIDPDFPNIGARAAVVSVGYDTVRMEQEAREVVTRMVEEFGSVFDEEGPLRTMKGDPMRIHMKEDVKVIPLNITCPRKMPHAYMDAAKAKIDSGLAMGIIERVEGPSRWCSAMSFVPKPNGKVRSVVDLVQLNKFVERPTHPFPAPKDIVARVPKGAKCFAVFDATNGYWQIPLEEESRKYMTFMTEWGRFRYKRAPMGLVSSGDEFCARTDRALAEFCS